MKPYFRVTVVFYDGTTLIREHYDQRQIESWFFEENGDFQYRSITYCEYDKYTCKRFELNPNFNTEKWT